MRSPPCALHNVCGTFKAVVTNSKQVSLLLRSSITSAGVLERALPGNLMHGHTQAAYMGNLVDFESRHEHITYPPSNISDFYFQKMFILLPILFSQSKQEDCE